jgi:hypothetical protein
LVFERREIGDRGGKGARPYFPHPRRRGDRANRFAQPGHRDNTSREQFDRDRFGQVLGQRADHHPHRAERRMGRMMRSDEGIERGPPTLIGAAIGAREIEQQQQCVEAAAHHRRKYLSLRTAVAPNMGMIVERIGNRDERPEQLLQFGLGRGRECGGLEREPLGKVGDQRRLAARAARAGDAVPAQWPADMKYFERFKESRRVMRPRNAAAIEQRIAQPVRSSERPGVRQCQRGAPGRNAGLERHQRNPGLAGGKAGLRKARDRPQGFEVQANRADPPVVEQRLDQIGRGGVGAISYADHVAERQAASLHGQIQGKIAALADDRDPAPGPVRSAVDRSAPVLIGPQRDPVESVDHAVAIGADYRHSAGRAQQFSLAIAPLGTGFGEVRGIANRTAGPSPRQLAGQFDTGLRGRSQEYRVGTAGKCLDGRKAGNTVHVLPSRIDWPDRSIEAEGAALADDLLRGIAADDGNAARSHQP